MTRRYFWNDGPPETGQTRGRMYVEGGLVSLEIETWDHEDRRSYDYNVRIPVADYRRVWRELRQGKGGKVEGRDGGSLSLGRKGDRVEMVLRDTPSPANTPGGSSLSGSVNISWSFEGLALTEDELVGPDEPIGVIFAGLTGLVSLGQFNIQDVQSIVSSASANELAELIALFQDVALLRESAAQAETDKWIESARSASPNQSQSMDGYYDNEVRSVSRGVQDVIRRIGAINAVLRDMYVSRVSDPGPVILEGHHLKIHCRSGIVEALVTFIGVGDCCWRSGRRVFRVRRSGNTFVWELVDYDDKIADLIGPIDDEHDRCFGDHASEFTRSCETWLQDNTAILRKNIGS